MLSTLKNPTQFYEEYAFHITHYHTKIHITHDQVIPSRIQSPVKRVLYYCYYYYYYYYHHHYHYSYYYI